MYYTKEYYVPRFKYELEEILSKWYSNNKDFKRWKMDRLLAIYYQHRRSLNEKMPKEGMDKVPQR